MNAKSQKCTPIQRSAAGLVAQGWSNVAVAEELGKNELTIRRWKKLPAFQALVDRLCDERDEEFSNQVKEFASRAMERFAVELDEVPYSVLARMLRDRLDVFPVSESRASLDGQRAIEEGRF